MSQVSPLCTDREALGFKPGRTISLPDYGEPASGFMGLDSIDCSADDIESLLDCVTSGWREVQCQTNEVARVRCDHPGAWSGREGGEGRVR